MHSQIHLIVAAAGLVVGGRSSFSAQVEQPPPTLAAIMILDKQRSDLAANVAKGAVKADDVVSQLLIALPPAGSNLDPVSYSSGAAVEMGRRLMALGKPAEAARFFEAAEKVLSAALKVAAVDQVALKVQYLQNLAQLRAIYLNQTAQAKADIEQAIALAPEDKSLPMIRDNLVREHPEIAAKKL